MAVSIFRFAIGSRSVRDPVLADTDEPLPSSIYKRIALVSFNNT